ncbi:MAG: radical SAM protein, partial [Actinomycetota bacterium]|nr:radical SAM protein [Actinomycetota bacterium]
MTGELRVVLGDLSHVKTGTEWSVLPMPINMGYLAAFTTQYFTGTLDIRICKSPQDLIDLVRDFDPHVVALSNYIWNANLAAAAAAWIRRVRPDTLIVMGGPNVNSTEPEAAIDFLATNPAIDYYIPQEGEVPFLRVLEALRAVDGERAGLTGSGIPGTWALAPGGASLLESSLTVPMAEVPGGLDARTGRLLDLDDIPSPYLTGVMDDYLAHPGYVPLIETNRGCPYSCTFCSWGDMAKSKSSSFPVERILKELDYIAEANVSRVSYLYLGDANFGLFQRDVQIAEQLRRLREERGFPDHVYLYFAKNSSKRVVEIAGILRGMTAISLSRQTQNPEVLDNIKRSNIDIDTFNALSRQAKSLGVDSFAELIYGLPGESLDSFLAGVAEVLDSDVDGLHFFPAMLLDGSEMATQASRRVFGLQGEYRAIDSATGDYGEFAATEFEEIVTTTAVFSRDDYFTVRRLHFVQSVLIDAHAGGRIFYALRGLTGGTSLYPLVESIAQERPSAERPFGRLMADFEAAASAEFISREQLAELRFTSREDARSLKLNPYFLSKLIYDASILEDFLALLQERIVRLYGQDPEVVRAALDFVRARIYPFDGQSSGYVDIRVALDDLTAAALAPKDRALGPASLLSVPQRIPVHKARTYSDQLAGDREGLPLHDAVYDLALHHSRENIGRMLTWEPDPLFRTPDLGDDSPGRSPLCLHRSRRSSGVVPLTWSRRATPLRR